MTENPGENLSAWREAVRREHLFYLNRVRNDGIGQVGFDQHQHETNFRSFYPLNQEIEKLRKKIEIYNSSQDRLHSLTWQQRFRTRIRKVADLLAHKEDSPLVWTKRIQQLQLSDNWMRLVFDILLIESAGVFRQIYQRNKSAEPADSFALWQIILGLLREVFDEHEGANVDTLRREMKNKIQDYMGKNNLSYKTEEEEEIFSYLTKDYAEEYGLTSPKRNA